MENYCTPGKHAGKVAVITGSTQGLGYAIAKRLASDGAHVVISSRKQENVDGALKSLHDEGFHTCSGMICHVTNSDHRKALIEHTITKHGRIDYLILNVATNPGADKKIINTSEEIFDKIMNVNVKSGFLMVQEVQPHMKASGGGSIVFISSVCGLIPEGWPGVYAVSKTALLGLTKALSYELVDDNIRVNSVAAGIFPTKFGSAITEDPALRKLMLRRIAQHRFGEPKECASVVSFLLSSDASYITGENIPVTGGLPTRL